MRDAIFVPGHMIPRSGDSLHGDLDLPDLACAINGHHAACMLLLLLPLATFVPPRGWDVDLRHRGTLVRLIKISRKRSD
jgi:hypothetical protein